MAGKRKKLRISGFSDSLKANGMEALEIGIGAVTGGIVTLELIRTVIPMVVATDTDMKRNIRDALLAAVGAGLLFLPSLYGGGALSKGAAAGIIGVSGMNIFMRYVSTPALGARRNHNRRLRVAGPHGSPVLQGPHGSPVLQGADGPMQNMGSNQVQQQVLLRMRRMAA